MADLVQGSRELAQRLHRIKDRAAKELRAELVRAGNIVADDARALAESSRRTGNLIESIHVTGPGETTPPHSTDGGQRTAGPFEVLVTAGNTDARHAHLVEGGTKSRLHKDGTSTGTMPAQPFFNPAWRLNRKRLEARINRLLRKAIREATK